MGPTHLWSRKLVTDDSMTLWSFCSLHMPIISKTDLWSNWVKGVEDPLPFKFVARMRAVPCDATRRWRPKGEKVLVSKIDILAARLWLYVSYIAFICGDFNLGDWFFWKETWQEEHAGLVSPRNGLTRHDKTRRSTVRKAQGVQVGVVVLNTLIDACCRCGDLMNAGKLLDDMVRGTGDICLGDLGGKRGLRLGWLVRLRS